MKLWNPRTRFILFILIALIYVAASQIPLYTEIQNTFPGTYYPLYHTNSDFDFNAYLSVITQSKHGEWLMRDVFTTEETNPTLFYFFFVLVGKFAGIYNLAPHIAYHVVRFAGVLFFLLALYKLTTKILGSQKGFWAAVFAIIGTISPLPLYLEPEAYNTYVPWWSSLEALKRLDQMPHYMWGMALMLTGFAALLSHLKSRRPAPLIVTLITFFIAGIFFPPVLLPIVFALPAAFALHTLLVVLKKKKWSVDRLRAYSLGLVLTVSAASLLLILREKTNGFPWDTWSDWETQRWSAVTDFERKLFISFNILPLLAIPAVIRIMRRPSLERLFIIVWAYLPFILLPFTDILGISNFRVSTVAPFVPLGILVSITAHLVYKRFRTRRFAKYSIFIIVFVLSFSVTIHVAPVLRNYVLRNRIATRYVHFYVPLSNWRGIQWLADNAPKDAVVIGNRFTGNIIPAHAPVKVYLGHHVHTKNFWDKEAYLMRFYMHEMTDEEARAFVEEVGIDYIFLGIGELKMTSDIRYEFATPVFQNSFTTIYEVEL